MISNQFEIIAQGRSYLQQLSREEYQQVLAPYFSSSAGKHMRHILDHYEALMVGLKSGVIDYDRRNRDTDMETDPSVALDMLNAIENWLTDLPESAWSMPVQVQCEVSLEQTQVETSQSTFGRELVFVASHAVHHYSLLAIIAKHLGKDVTATFGLAPATATYLRDCSKSFN